MGASTDFRRFKASEGLPKIKESWKNQVEQSLYEDGHSYSGTIGMLGTTVAKWVDRCWPSVDDAYDFISNTHQKWEPAIAVSYLYEGEKWWLIGGWCSS